MPRDYSLQVLCNVSYSSADWLPVMGGIRLPVRWRVSPFTFHFLWVSFAHQILELAPLHLMRRDIAILACELAFLFLIHRIGRGRIPQHPCWSYSCDCHRISWWPLISCITGCERGVLERDIIIKIRRLFCGLLLALLGNLLKSRLWLRAIPEHRTLCLLSAHRLSPWLLPLVLVF